jgi:DNA invertase Pin-like site-specific DNA recombinase
MMRPGVSFRFDVAPRRDWACRAGPRQLTVNLLGCFAEFETNLRKERQAEGIAKAKAAGVYKGRPPSIDVTKIRDMKKKGFGASEIAKALKIGRASVYRALEA